MTPEQGAVELIERGLPEMYRSVFLDGGRIDVDAMKERVNMMSSGEQVIAAIAAELWRGTGTIGVVSRILDRENGAIVLGVLSAVWLGDET